MSAAGCPDHGPHTSPPNGPLAARWRWRVTGYYRDGCLALQTVHSADHGKDVEVSVFESRPDIGRVVVEDLRDSREGVT